MATGGESIARLDDGRVVFVSGGLPDETVQVVLTEQKKRFARGIVAAVVEPSPHRRQPGCTHAEAGECGGCDWMHLEPPTQQLYKVGIVVEQLERLGRVDAPQVSSVMMDRGRRTTVRCSVTNGSAGYRRRRSDEVFAAQSCQAAHPLLEELLVEARFGDATEVSMRCGAATGDRLVLTNGDVAGVSVPDDVLVAPVDAVGAAALHERVSGRRWRVSANSFFQTSWEGAEALVAAVGRGIEGTSGSVVDLYAGVGLLGGAAAPDRLSTAVESNPSSVGDAVRNLGDQVQVIQSRVERWTPVDCEVVIADPARRGLAKDGVTVVDQTNASRLVLVSCDPAALGRDTALLTEHGWTYQRGELIDMFPDTSRIEVVSTFTRDG